MLDLDASNLRDWLATVGLLRVTSDVTNAGTVRWRAEHGRYRPQITDAPPDLANLCAEWVEDHKSAWQFADLQNVNFGPQVWRENAAHTAGLEAAVWCALGADAVLHRDGQKIQASRLEYGHGGGHQHWLASMRASLSGAVTVKDFTRILAGGRDDGMRSAICRWDFECERQHAYRGRDPAKDTMSQDGTINALAAIGLASCPSMPTQRGLITPLVYRGDVLRWPIWTQALRIADLEAALLCPWSWPTMQGRRWIAGQLYCFSRGELREPEMTDF